MATRAVTRFAVTETQMEHLRRRLETGGEALQAALSALEAHLAEAEALSFAPFDHSHLVHRPQSEWDALYPAVFEATWRVPAPYAHLALAAALHFRLTGARASMALALKALEFLATGYTFDIEHFDVGMNYAVWNLPLLFAADLLRPDLHESLSERLEAYFRACLSAVSANDAAWFAHNWGGAWNNHYAWHKALIALASLYLDEPAGVKKALFGPAGVSDLLSHAVVDDGLWHESATGYQFVAVSPLMQLAFALKNAGWPFDLLAAEFEGKSLRQLFEAPLALLLPDARLPELPAPLYALAYAAWGEPAFAWAAQLEPFTFSPGLACALCWLAEGDFSGATPPQPATRLFPEHGYTLLASPASESYFAPDTAACFVTWGKSNIHGHQDKLGIELYAGGLRWLRDAEGTSPGHSFSSAIQRTLNRSTLAHNTVCVDQSSQRGLPVELEASVFDARANLLEVRDSGRLYPGVSQIRRLELQPKALVDEFHLDSTSSHIYDYQLHFPPGAELEVPLDLRPFTFCGAGREYEWILSASATQLDSGALAFACNYEGKRLEVHLSAPPGSLFILAELAANSERTPPHVPLVLVRAESNEAHFSARFTL